jgi:CRISPR-associated protein Cas1
MNPLYLSGFGVSLNVDGARLIVKDGFLEPDSSQQKHEFQPRRMLYDSVVIDGQTGAVSVAAIRWLIRHGVPLFILDYNGTLLSSTLPKEPVNGSLKIAQIDAYRDQTRRFYIAKKLVEAKAQRSFDVLRWLAERYGKFDSEVNFKTELVRLARLRVCRACNQLKEELLIFTGSIFRQLFLRSSVSVHVPMKPIR